MSASLAGEASQVIDFIWQDRRKVVLKFPNGNLRAYGGCLD